MMFKKKRKKQALPSSVIIAASNGDVNAMMRVLNHYEGYMKAFQDKEMRVFEL